MLTDLNYIVQFVLEALLKSWPYLLLTVPLAVAVRWSNASSYIRKAFVQNEVIAIILAVAIGAFSPFCSCGVIPIITSLLIARVPLAPIMAFWIASPTMDPEIFLLSVGMLGWELAVVRVVATLILSLAAGFITLGLERQGFFAEGVLRSEQPAARKPLTARLRGGVLRLRQTLMPNASYLVTPSGTMTLVAAETTPSIDGADTGCGCGETSCATNTCSTSTCSGDSAGDSSRTMRFLREAGSAAGMVLKFMLLAYLLEALITLYVPQETIVQWLGTKNPLAIAGAGLIGLPIYTSNLTALPLVAGLLEQGMVPGAALAFLLAGPVTTIPAMTAVYGIAKPRVFMVYALIGMVGAVVMGYAYQMALSL